VVRAALRAVVRAALRAEVRALVRAALRAVMRAVVRAALRAVVLPGRLDSTTKSQLAIAIVAVGDDGTVNDAAGLYHSLVSVGVRSRLTGAENKTKPRRDLKHEVRTHEDNSKITKRCISPH
jgi:hypothetical protein